MSGPSPVPSKAQVPSVDREEGLQINLVAYNEMRVGANCCVISREERAERRLRHGFCPQCQGGAHVQLFWIKRSKLNPLWVTKVPRSVPGECADGVCYVCHPDRDPNRKDGIQLVVRESSSDPAYTQKEEGASSSQRPPQVLRPHSRTQQVYMNPPTSVRSNVGGSRTYVAPPTKKILDGGKSGAQSFIKSHKRKFINVLFTMFPSDPFQRLWPGEILNRTFRILAQRYDLFLIISGGVFLAVAPDMNTRNYVLRDAFHTLMGGSTWNSHHSATITTMMHSNQGENGGGSVVVMLHHFHHHFMIFVSCHHFVEYGVVGTFFLCGGTAAMVYAVAELYTGRNPSLIDCCKKACQRGGCNLFLVMMLIACADFGWRLLIQSILHHLLKRVFLYLLTFCVWVVGHIFMQVSLAALLVPVIMVEGMGPLGAIKRCWELSVYNRWYIFGILYYLTLLYNAVKLLLYFVMGLRGGEDLIFSTWGSFVIFLPFWITFH